ncbi:hypothetical protein [Streptomyces sp. KS 21]|uniref:hypothetical protein n=1 Tax=Streptomyces sp. KS 21 TaxID=2485150 RepID=UPI0010630236|nr:hypothetical protein [Streptomyces sp. KS 21]TDU77555.1 hypothetical protein EDD91_4314 [Streptomyces sp. KS 21]
MAERLRIEVQRSDADIESLMREIDTLRRDLLELDVVNVERPEAGPAPPGTRAGALELANGLLVTLPAAMTLLKEVVSVVGDWRSRATSTSDVTLKIGDHRLVLTGADPTEQRRLIDAWLLAVRAGGGPEEADGG